MYWAYFSWAKFSRPFGGKNVALIAVIHHSRGICFIEKFGARATTVREAPQFIKDTTALSWKSYLWEHCCHTCHWLAACHHNAVQLSIHSCNCRGDVWEPAWLILSVSSYVMVTKSCGCHSWALRLSLARTLRAKSHQCKSLNSEVTCTDLRELMPGPEGQDGVSVCMSECHWIELTKQNRLTIINS